MQFTAAAAAAFLALAGSGLAMPNGRPGADCTFGTYRCTVSGRGIEICTINKVFELVGDCPSGTACSNIGAIPYCQVPPKTVAARNGRDQQPPIGWCGVPGRYECLGETAIQVCGVDNKLVKVGDCPANSHCGNLNGIPFCLDNKY